MKNPVILLLHAFPHSSKMWEPNMASLSKKYRVIAPDLAGALLAHYPVRAKELGESGAATLSLVVRPDGRVGAIEVRSASSPEFGQACVETVRPSTWAPPLDKDGRVTATRVGYTCRFDVH